MYNHQNKWYSSFLSIADHPQGISNNLCVLTIRSGSQGNGGHVTMYVEMPEPLAAGCFSTQKLELTAMKEHPEPVIAIAHVQLSSLQGQLVKDELDKKRNQAGLLQTHHACYKIDINQAKSLIAAARRFKDKAAQGRYVYHQEGGIKARFQTRPGIRGVNCADFVIKITREAGIANLGYKYKSTPYRVASGGIH